MKTTINKETITLAEVHAANELRTEYMGYNADMVETIINNAIMANAHKISNNRIFNISSKDILNIEKAEITKNRFIVTVWMSCTVKVDPDTIVYIAFDANQSLQYCEGATIDAFIEVYRKR